MNPAPSLKDYFRRSVQKFPDPDFNRPSSKEEKLVRSNYDFFKKKINSLIEKKEKKKALAYLPKLNSELMRVAKTGVIKKKNASRNISRITRKINSL